MKRVITASSVVEDIDHINPLDYIADAITLLEKARREFRGNKGYDIVNDAVRSSRQALGTLARVGLNYVENLPEE